MQSEVVVTKLPCTEHPGHWGVPVFIFDINARGFRAVIFDHGVVTSLAGEQVWQADEAINLSLACLCRDSGLIIIKYAIKEKMEAQRVMGWKPWQEEDSWVRELGEVVFGRVAKIPDTYVVK